MNLRFLYGLLVLIFCAVPAAAGFIEPDSLKEKVAKGELPPIDQRLPKEPLKVTIAGEGKAVGQYGGTARILIGGQRNISLMTVYGYTRLLRYNEKLELQPDLLQSYDVQEGRIFTFHLRPGLKWSDGQPVTTEDFRYALEDVQFNEDLSKVVSPYLLVDGKAPVFEIIDDQTVRYTWDAPNPDFLPQIAAPQALSLLMPAHYLKQFHKKYQTEEKLDELTLRTKRSI